jgi:regulator of sigma E protease
VNFLSTAAAFLVALGVLIAFHEYGHYLAARLSGVKVLRFCLGFGRPIVMRRFGRDGTEWALAAFPLGGYVKLLGHDPDEPVPPEDVHRSFNAQPVARRVFIILAGPLANFILAIALYWGLNMSGVEEPPALIGKAVAGSLAESAGLAAGDAIVSGDGERIVSWNDLHWRLLRAAEARRPVRLEVRRAAGDIAFPVLDLARLRSLELEGDFMKSLGLTIFRPPPKIVQVEPDSPAERAGVLPGDVLLSVAGKPIATGEEFVSTMRASAGQARLLEVRRAGQVMRMSVVPAPVDTAEGRIGRIGARIGDRVDPILVRYGFTEAFGKGLSQTWEMSVFSLKMLGNMLTGEVSWRNLSGPVTIADYAGKTARLGWAYYLNFIALVSISLGVLNLLPIPMLDGGHLLYYLLEILRGKPVSERVMEIGSRLGFAVVITTMALALYNDIHRLLAG